jgi:hypothetical protein
MELWNICSPISGFRALISGGYNRSLYSELGDACGTLWRLHTTPKEASSYSAACTPSISSESLSSTEINIRRFCIS